MERSLRLSTSAIANQALAVASTAAGTVSSPWEPTSSVERSTGVTISRVCAAIPAAVPTATASVGETSNQTTVNEASAMPRKIAGKIGPPRKPQPRLTP